MLEAIRKIPDNDTVAFPSLESKKRTTESMFEHNYCVS